MVARSFKTPGRPPKIIDGGTPGGSPLRAGHTHPYPHRWAWSHARPARIYLVVRGVVPNQCASTHSAAPPATDHGLPGGHLNQD